ncbi:hypothetical protein [Microcoleus sp. OTE_8_concoct_300]|uniref:hypothetical protein n=1 Tax=Microcoleus sp. OTE_8_concoct_300 TaxID=2964710 RepID=UPI00403F7819
METKKILIATKTYPSISTKYRETVCTAGVIFDEEEKPLKWVHIYPIRFRQLDFDRRYPICSSEIVPSSARIWSARLVIVRVAKTFPIALLV